MTTAFTLKDGPKLVKFDGQLLGKSSSDDGKAQRWTEIEVYHSDSGRYVVQKIGRSVVYHRDGSSCTRSAKPIGAAHIDEDNMIPCTTCRPDLDQAGNNRVLLEQDRFSVQIADTAQGLVEVLRSRSQSGEVFLTSTAVSAIEDAASRDDAIREAYSTQRV